MFIQGKSANQAVYAVVVLTAIAVISIKLIRAFLQSAKRPWPMLFVGIYNILLLLLFLLGMVTQASWEGFGSMPLLALTLPWSGLAIWLLGHTGLFDHDFSGSSFDPTFLINFIVCNIFAASINSCILYFLLKRRQRKVAEDEAWEQARRDR